MLETVLKNGGHETKIFDTSFYRSVVDPSYDNIADSGTYQNLKGLSIPIKEQDPYEDLRKTVKEFGPDIVAFTFYSVNEDIHRMLLGPLKVEFPAIKIICGGPAASINPALCLEEDYIDMACCGEGEGVLLELCKRMDIREDYNNISGLWVRDENGNIHNNGVAKLTDLDSLPVQDWDSYDPIQIHGLFEGEAYRMGHVEFTRGCPYNCSYCGSGSIRKSYLEAGMSGYVRHKSPEKFVEECKHLAEKYDLNLFYFVDGTFTAMSSKTLAKLSKLYKEQVGVPFIALVHPSTINDETARLLSEMGCLHVSIGVESGVQEFRKNVLNRNMTDEKIIDAVRCLRKHNIHVSSYNMIGIPGMDREHVFKTIELNRKANPNSTIVGIFIPFPDAELTKKLVSMGMLNEDAIVTNGMYPTVKIDDMTDEEINGLFNTFNLYIKFPKFTWSFIRKLEKDNIVSRFVRKTIYKILSFWRAYEILKLKRRIGRGK
jgi:radical SAM superfamily enzyme YgiQ (UPF0313 family)